MRISSAKQYEMSLESPASPSQGGNLGVQGITAQNDDAPIEVPAFQSPDFAETSRLAGRLNAATTSDFELADLLRERQTLLDKKFAQTITRSEENRLALVRWSIDRIEDARHGLALEQLDIVVSKYEKVLTTLQSLGEQIAKQAGAGSERGSGRARRRKD